METNPIEAVAELKLEQLAKQHKFKEFTNELLEDLENEALKRNPGALFKAASTDLKKFGLDNVTIDGVKDGRLEEHHDDDCRHTFTLGVAPNGVGTEKDSNDRITAFIYGGGVRRFDRDAQGKLKKMTYTSTSGEPEQMLEHFIKGWVNEYGDLVNVEPVEVINELGFYGERDHDRKIILWKEDGPNHFEVTIEPGGKWESAAQACRNVGIQPDDCYIEEGSEFLPR
jgi:hypothetical protein